MRLTRKQNKELCEKYPFLVPYNVFTGEVIHDYDYEYTELDNMPDGWRIAFGERLCEELRKELIEHNYLDKYRILDIKEKYGGLRWYDNGSPQSIHDIIHKYEDMSYRTCIVCGNPATKITTCWISPYCDKCLPSNEQSVNIDEYYK